MPKNHNKNIQLAVFKGRKTQITKATLHLLSVEPLLKYDVHKRLIKQGYKNTRYTTINTQITLLEKQGYLQKAGTRMTQPGSERTLYQTTYKGLLALKIAAIDMDKIFTQLDESLALQLLTTLTCL